MNILGMGPLELLVIALLAFILLGPQRLADGARLLGKATKEVRRMTDELPKIVLEENQAEPSPNAPSRNDHKSGEESAGEKADGENDNDSPVAFRSAHGQPDAGGDEPAQERDK